MILIRLNIYGYGGWTFSLPAAGRGLLILPTWSAQVLKVQPSHFHPRDYSVILIFPRQQSVWSSAVSRCWLAATSDGLEELYKCKCFFIVFILKGELRQLVWHSGSYYSSGMHRFFSVGEISTYSICWQAQRLTQADSTVWWTFGILIKNK